MKEVSDVLSLGMGVQSTALYIMSAMGELPRIDYAVFADTGKEKASTYRYLDFLLKWKEQHNGPEILVRTDKNLYEDLLAAVNSRGERFASIPAFTTSDNNSQGMLLRQCTGEYKIAVVDKVIREVNGLKPRQRNIETNIWKGITLEEADRMAKPEDKWKNYIYPFIGYAVPGRSKWIKLPDNECKPANRSELITWYRKNKLPIPKKSSCVFCPYTSDADWEEMRLNEPEDFEAAVKIDYAIRDSSNRGVQQQIYLHRSLQPLDKVVFDPNNKIPFGECSGTCHV